MKLLRFYGEWCTPCKRFEPILRRFSEKHGIPIQDIDVDKHADLATAYDIRSVPTTILIKDGEIAQRISGAYPMPVLESSLREFL